MATRSTMLSCRGSGLRGVGLLAVALVLGGCATGDPFGTGGGPAAPRDFDAYYYGGSVVLTWSLSSSWDGEPFRVWGKRVSDAEYFLIAEVSSCSAGECSYSDPNVLENVTYVYYVSAVDRSGLETSSAEAIEVYVPPAVAPPVPTGVEAVALDSGIYLRWSDVSRSAEDFSFYRVYLDDGAGVLLLLGETDTEGFLDLLVGNGETYGYAVSAVDSDGHESAASVSAFGTPRPDFHGELVYAYEDEPGLSGFRFQADESSDPVLSGDDPIRDFRVESDGLGWWLVPGPGVQVSDTPVFTTALKCGPAADAGCVDLSVAPAGGYTSGTLQLVPEFSYVVRVPADGGWQYGVVRISHIGFAQNGAIVIFDWAFQLQVDNPNLVSVPTGLR